MDSNELLAGQVLSERYRIDAQIAVGGMAYVYRAYDLRLERNVALKIWTPFCARLG
jgi:serine/threonine-protein kinase